MKYSFLVVYFTAIICNLPHYANYTQFDLTYTMIEWVFLCAALFAATYDLILVVNFALCGLLIVDPLPVALFYWQKTIFY